MKESFVEFCPVPLDQQPIHEYEELRDSGFFQIATLEPVAYIIKLVWRWILALLVTAPISAASFPPQKMPFLFLLGAAGGSGLFVLFAIVRLYLGWSYVADRLKQETVFYEESGWYDGQTWEKPLSILNRDRLIVSYEIEPIFRRLRLTLAILGSLGAIDVFLLVISH
jgi:Conserved in the green lineage and diatoms 27